MSRKKRTHSTKHMPSDEQMKASGIRELTAEELLKVNGGGQVEGAGPVCGPAPDIPDDPPSSGSSSSGGSLSGGSESSSGSSSSGNTSGGSSSNSGSSGGGNGSSGGSSGTNDSSPPPSSTPSEPVTGGNSDDTGGGYTDYPEAGYIDYQESGGSSGGGSSNGSSGSSDNHSSDSGNADSGYSDDSWGGSSDNDSSDSGGSYTGGSYTGGGFTYTPPVHNQEPSAPSPIEETVEETQNVQENTGVTSSLPQKPTSEQDTRPPERLKDRFNTANEGREEEKSQHLANAQIKAEAQKYNHRHYIVGENEFRCDNYVEAVLKDCRQDPSKYFAGAAKGTTVEEHISNAREKGFAVNSKRYIPANLEDGAYIVLMNSSPKGFDAHAGLFFKEGTSIEFRDNSSGNRWADENGTQFKGGVIKQSYSSTYAFQTDYSYNNFYYIKIN